MSSSSFSRPGAIDLSQLAARAKAAATPAPGSAPGPTGASYVLESSEQTFEADAVRRSTQHPVVLELYSPRVATGQQLSDVLESIANASGGRFLLVRLNVDTAPGIVSALQLQAVPTVLAIIAGQAVPLFQGVQPRDQVQLAVDQVLKSAVANGLVGRAQPVAARGPADGAADVDDLDDEPGADPRFAAADEALAAGDFVRAHDEFDKLVQADPNDAEAALGKAQAGLFARASVLDPDLTSVRAGDPKDVAAQLDAADLDLVSGRVEQAFERLLAVVRRGGSDRDTARVRLLELFETVGGTDPRVVAARRSLMAALF